MRAVQDGLHKCTFALLTTGQADASAHDRAGFTVLHRVVVSQTTRYISKLQELKAYGIRTDMRTATTGETVLHLAAKTGWWEGVQYVVETWRMSAIDHNVEHKLPSELASVAGYHCIAKYLRRKEKEEELASPD